MLYAIISLNGKQYKVKKGDVLETERLDSKKEDKVTFENVLLLSLNDTITIGTPKVKGAVVKATVLENTKGEKIRVAKFKAKVRYRRVTGKRQSLTRVKIDEIKIDTV